MGHEWHDHLFWLPNLNWTTHDNTTTGHSPMLMFQQNACSHSILTRGWCVSSEQLHFTLVLAVSRRFIFAYDTHFVDPNSKSQKYPPQHLVGWSWLNWMCVAQIRFTSGTISHQHECWSTMVKRQLKAGKTHSHHFRSDFCSQLCLFSVCWTPPTRELYNCSWDSNSFKSGSMPEE